ncbi:RecQ family zinc-binding domain-containing protein [Halobacillus litoralis]|uniref:RecQ family zinc-binding domain-containing protein n=1 Tax=Halobacillus litoralis TaxID=45668 RepID=UPI00273EB53D|nr:RecQ family zinc-binding domain-containing protein [Halobacillus litoralis]WLR46714.1 RecQ family zinc-binding domain-containing protein [Halobacillus litoralis]
MIERFELSESQWNFIKFQLEEEGALHGGRLIGVTPELIQEIHRFLEERWQYKHNKLNEMLRWIHVSDCRREALYKPFQDMIRTPTVPCCDECDFNIDELSFQEERQTYDTFSWEDRLKLIFKQGVGL